MNIFSNAAVVGEFMYERLSEIKNAAIENSAKSPTQTRGSPEGKASRETVDAKNSGNKKITVGMSDDERTEILRNKEISVPVYRGEANASIEGNIADLESRKRTVVENALIRIADEFNAKGNYNIEDVELEVSFSNKSIRESSNKSITDPKKLAKLLPILGDAVKNAIGIETHDNRYFYDNNTKRFHELIGGYIDGDSFIPVRFGVKELNDGSCILYVVICQEKTKTEVFGIQAAENSASHTPRPVSISIAQIAKNVNSQNKDLLRYFPNGLLNEEQRKTKDEAIAETVEYTNAKNDKAYIEAIKRGDIRNAKIMLQNAAKAAGYSANSDYQGTSAFNGAAPSNEGYYDSIEERIAAWEDGSYEGSWSLAEEVSRGKTGVSAVRRSEGGGQAFSAASNGTSVTENTGETQKAAEGNFEVSAEGETIVNSSGDVVDIVEISTMKDGEMILKVKNSEGVESKVRANDISYASESEAHIYEAVAAMGMDAASANAIINTYDPSQSAEAFILGIKTTYNMGISGVPLSYAAKGSSASFITQAQRVLAYKIGKAVSEISAKTQESTNKGNINSKAKRKKGTVKGEGVKLADLKKRFNDTQNKAYKLLSTYAEVTGIDIVLYSSKADANGNFTGAQGKFRWSEDKIYIDINSGLSGVKDVNGFAKYAMLRTFSHEFTHFIEKWSPIWYNEFRKAVFDELTANGENVHDLIEIKMAMSEGMSYEQASREVVAEAMTDILPDAKFVEKLAVKHKNIFEKLLERLKMFVRELKAHFKVIGHNPSREANALKKQIGDSLHYAESIVKLFDKVAVEAVENYQRTVSSKGSDIVQEQIRDYNTERDNINGREEQIRGEAYIGRDGERISKIYPLEQVAKSAGNITVVDRNSDKSRRLKRRSGKTLLSTDSEGRLINSSTLERLADTSVVDEDGHIIVVYHATNKDFDKFAKGDIGFHFGDNLQAQERARQKKIDNPKLVRAYLNIKNPIVSSRDTMCWDSKITAINLWSENFITDSERAEIDKLYQRSDDEYNSPAAVRLREILESKGYDGIAYPNGFEGDGLSYIAFHNEQIILTRNNSEVETTIDEEGALLAYKSGGSYALNAKIREGAELNEQEQNIVDNLDRALENLPTYQGKVYRNIQFDGFGDAEARDAFMAEHVVGNGVQYDAYTSTSKDIHGYVLDGKYAVHLEIESISGRDTNGHGSDSESEVLFPRDTYFVVNNIIYDENRTPTLYLTEANTNERVHEGRNDGYTRRDKTGESGSRTYTAKENKVQRVSKQNTVHSAMQPLPERNTQGDTERKTDLRGIQGEVTQEQSRGYLGNNAKRRGRTASITQENIKELRDIGRKSVNAFTSEDIKKAEPWARKFYAELGTKSPFFRAWFGDWRAYDRSKIKTVTVENIDLNDVVMQNGDYSNPDTGWTIHAGSLLEGDTISHARGEKISVKVLNDVKNILENAVLLDTEISERNSNKKSSGTAFMHKLYAPITYNGKPYIAKISVEEFLDVADEKIKRRGYNLRAIKIEAVNRSLTDNTSATTPQVETASIGSIADLHNLVKTYDEKFSPKDVNPLLLNEDGTPKMFYHGTDGDFNSFSREKRGSRGKALNFGMGFYFTPKKSIAENYTSTDNVMSVYLDVKSPYEIFGSRFYRDDLDKIAEISGKAVTEDNVTAVLKEIGYDSIIARQYNGTTNPVQQIVVFENTQIKSATDNIGTFDGRNPDIRYQQRTSTLTDRELLAAAFESVAKTELEKKKLSEYRGKISLIESEQKKLHDIRAEIKELSFAKGKRNTERIKELRFEENKTANRINTYDRQLLNMEASAPLKAVLEREKSKAYKKAEERGKEALKEYRTKAKEKQKEISEKYQESRKKAVEGRRKTEMRRRVKRAVSELNSLLLNPTKEKHIPIGLQKPVAAALEVINMDTVGAEERVNKYNELIARHGHKSKINVITNSDHFFNEPTMKLTKNPNRQSKDFRQSRFSVPVWENDTYLEAPKSGYWKFIKKRPHCG